MKPIDIVPKPRPHYRIRSRMYELGVDASYMAKRLGMSDASYSFRMNARRPWRLNEMYDVMDILGIPSSEMNEYFPDMRDSKQ